MFLMWLGEQITARGVGNGVSLIIFAGIVARVVPAAGQLLQPARAGNIVRSSSSWSSPHRPWR